MMLAVPPSLSGVAVLHLLPLSRWETPKVSLWRGGYPEVVARPDAARSRSCFCLR